MLILRDLGGLALESGGPRAGGALAQPARLAILAVIAQSGPRGVSRDQLLALFWPDSDTERARGALNQALYALRRDAGELELTLGTSILRPNPDVIRSDAMEFERLLDAGDLEAAAAVYAGPFLDGVHVDASGEFERWVEARRELLARRHAVALGTLAREATTRGDHAGAAGWWRRLAALDPLDGGAALGLVQALAGAGDRAGALRHAARHEAALREELELAPDPAFAALVASLRTAPGPGESRTDVARAPAPAQPTDSPPGQVTPSPRPAPRRRILPTALTLIAGALALLVFAGPRLFRQRAVAVSEIHPVANSTVIEFQPAVSPDGKSVAFVVWPQGAKPLLVVRSSGDITSGGEVRLAEDPDLSPWLPSWSRDGESVRYLACPGTRIPRTGAGCHWRETSRMGGGVREIPLPRTTSAAAWSPDDARVAFSVQANTSQGEVDSLFSYSPADRKLSLIGVHRRAARGLHSLAWSPDGRWLAYVNGNPPWRVGVNQDIATIWMIRASGGEPIPVTSGEVLSVSPAWLDRDHLLLVSNRDGPRGIYVVEIGAHGPRGEPRSIPGVSDAHSISYSTAGHALAYARYTPRVNIRSFPTGGERPISIREGSHITDGNQIIETAEVSPDGRWLVYDSDVGGSMDIYKLALAGGPALRLTRDPGNEMGPRWSPDGREIAFYGGVDVLHAFVMPADGGPYEAVADMPGSLPAWSPDGHEIAFGRSRTPEVWRSRRDAAGGPWQAPVLVQSWPADSVCEPQGWAPDGAGILCQVGSQLRVISRDGRVVWQRDTRGPCPAPRYAPGGRTIYCLLDNPRGIWAMPIGAGSPRLVVADDDPAVRMDGAVTVGAARLYLTVSENDSDVWVMTLRP